MYPLPHATLCLFARGPLALGMFSLKPLSRENCMGREGEEESIHINKSLGPEDERGEAEASFLALLRAASNSQYISAAVGLKYNMWYHQAGGKTANSMSLSSVSTSGRGREERREEGQAGRREGRGERRRGREGGGQNHLSRQILRPCLLHLLLIIQFALCPLCLNLCRTCTNILEDSAYMLSNSTCQFWRLGMEGLWIPLPSPLFVTSLSCAYYSFFGNKGVDCQP